MRIFDNDSKVTLIPRLSEILIHLTFINRIDNRCYVGMSITYSIINDLHNGEIKVNSELGKGTKIELKLPKNLKK
mgnify:CR=1 FL=1